MATAYLNKALEIPNVSAQRIDWELVGERSRTAGGNMRQDLVAVKRTWKLTSIFVTPTYYTTIINTLNILNWRGWFWLDEFGGTASTDSIMAFYSIDEDERVQFRRGKQWINNGRRLVLTVTER